MGEMAGVGRGRERIRLSKGHRHLEMAMVLKTFCYQECFSPLDSWGGGGATTIAPPCLCVCICL